MKAAETVLMSLTVEAEFPVGEVVASAEIAQGLREGTIKQRDLSVLIIRHMTADWGIVDRFDAGANDDALRAGSRLLSAYNLKDGRKVWIITEADRSYTTILFPEEY